MRNLCFESAVFVAFRVLFIESAGFHAKSTTFHENQQKQVNVCIHVPFTHTGTTKYHQNMIYLVGLPSVLYERPGQNDKPVLIQLFSRCFSLLFMCFS